MENPVLIVGAGGQVGRALLEQAEACGQLAFGLTRNECDLAEIETLAQKVDGFKPSAIINAAAYTAVDKAEEEEPRANLVNAQAPAILAAYCRKADIPLIHYSTDYVFNGEGGDRPWQETDEPDPLNAYGRSKLTGEEVVVKYGAKHLIFRTSWVYDAAGKNFFNTMLRLGCEHEELKVVDDQMGAPTYAPHLAAATWMALSNARKAMQFPSGIYHLCGGGETSWMGFAKQIFSEAYKQDDLQMKVKQVYGIPTRDYPTPAMRPLNSRLDCSKAKQVLGVELPQWEVGVKDCMEVRE